MAARAWNGDLRRVPFPEVLAALHRERADGTLYCVRHSTTRTVQVGEGLPFWASSSDPDDSTRAWLFRRGHLAAASTGADLERQTAEHLADPAFRVLIEDHARELILDLFSWGDGAFIFQPFPEPPQTLLRIETSFEALLSQGLKRVRRLSVVNAGAGARDSRLMVAADVPMDRLLTLDDDVCLVLGEVTSGASADLPIDGWPCDYRVLLCLWQLRMLGFVVPANGRQGVEVMQLLRGSTQRYQESEEHERPQEFARPVLRAQQVVEDLPSAEIDAALLMAAASPSADFLRPGNTRMESAGTAGRSAPSPPAPTPPAPSREAEPPRPEPASRGGPPTQRVKVEPITFDHESPSRASTTPRVPPIHDRESRESIPMPPRPQAEASMPLDPPVLAVPVAAPASPPATIAAQAPPQPSAVVRRARPSASDGLEDLRNLMAEDDEEAGSWRNERAPRVDDLNTSDLKDISSTGAATSAADWFKTGERFVRELDFHNAITSFREAVEIEPNNPDYQFRLGSMLARNPKWRREAEEHLLRAAELKPWDARYQLALGKLYADAGVKKRAEARYKAVLENDPLNQAALKELKKLGAKVGEHSGGAAGLLDKLSKLGKSSKGDAAESTRPATSEELEAEPVL